MNQHRALKASETAGRREPATARAKAAVAVCSPRERLLDTTAELIGRDGYRATTVAQISKRARVSSATFYSLFKDKDECFVAAHQQLTGRLLEEVTRRMAPNTTAWREVLAALFDFAEREPNAIRLLADEATMSIGRALQERDRLLASLEAVIAQQRSDGRGESDEPDLPAKALLGGTLRLLVRRLRMQNGSLQDLHDGVILWAESYRVPRPTARWQTLSPTPGMVAGPPAYASGLEPPPRPSRGRNRLTPEQIARNQRERIIHATATVASANGYVGTTVTDIVATAGLAREVFYRHFKDKQDAFIQTYETSFQALMALVIKAFYTSADWPERLWAALRVYTDFMVNFSSFAHLGIVESNTLPRDVIGITEERVMAFTVFLNESYRGELDTTAQPEVVREAIAMSVYEITAHLLRNKRGHELPGMTPLLTYIAMTPFTGPERASGFLRQARRDVDS